MRPGYVIIAPQSSGEAVQQAASVAEGVRAATGMVPLACGSVRVLVNTALPHRQTPDGFVLGTLYDAGMPATGTGAQSIEGADGWGNAVTIARVGRAVRVMRSPFGTLPCYYARVGDAVIAASDARLLLLAGLRQPAIDIDALCGFLLADQYRDERTLLSGVLELLPGAALTISEGRTSAAMTWSPWPWTLAPLAEHEAPLRLRDVVRHVTATMVRPYRRPLVSLSGGLDSSIVTHCLAETGAPLACLNLYTGDTRGDERRYARIVADSVRAVLHERREDPAAIDLHRSAAAHLPRPVSRAFAQSGDLQHRMLAEAEGIDAFFSGGGGDNVFAYIPAAAPIVDRWRIEGVGPAVRTAADLARMTRSPLADVLLKAGRRAFRPAAYRWAADRLFLSGDLAQMRPTFSHPWLSPPPGVPPGKALHVALIMQFVNHIDGFDRENVAPRLLPLMTQPVVEVCLAIPTWQWCAGGRNRAVARRAFFDLPEAILARTEKGTPGGLLRALFETRTETILSMLESGILMRNRLIDFAEITRIAAQPRLAPDLAVFRIMRFVDIEAWARHWA